MKTPIFILLTLLLFGCNQNLGKITYKNGVFDPRSFLPGLTPTFTAGDVVEGNGLSVTFTLPDNLESATTFDWIITGTDVSGDFSLTSGTITLGIGANAGVILIPTIENTIYDLNRTYQLSIRANVPDSIGSVDQFLVLDDEAVPVLQFQSASQNINENALLPSVNLTLVPASKFPVTVDFTVSGSASPGGVDHSLIDGSINFSAGQTSASLSLPVVDDSLAELAETIEVTLGTVTGTANFGVRTLHTATIVDNEVTNLSINDVSVSEGGVATFTVTLSSANTVDVTFDWATSDGTGTSVSDYDSAFGTGVTIPAGSLSTSITVSTRNDSSVCEIDKTFNVDITNVQNSAVSDATGEGTVVDPDLPSVSFALASSSSAEGTATDTIATASANLSAACGTHAVDFDVTSTAGTAVSGVDFTAIPLTTFTIPAGNPSLAIPITLKKDALYENDETLTLTMSNVVGATAGTQPTHVLTIQNDDARPTLSIADVSVSEGTNASPQLVTMTITQSAVSGLSTQFNYATSDGTATQPSDYASTSGTLTIAPGQTSATFSVSVVRDSVDEFDETVNLTLSGGNGNYDAAGGDLTGVLTLTNNDLSPNLDLVAPGSAVEGGGAHVFKVNLSAASGKPVTFDFNTSDLTAIAPGDYTARSSSHTIPAGSTTLNISVTSIDDSVNCETTESFRGTVSNVTNATVSTSTADAQLTENDIPMISFSSATVTEGGDASLTVNTDRACPVTAITGTYATFNNQAIDGQDFMYQSGSFTIPATQMMSAAILIPTTDDGIPELTETFFVGLRQLNVGTASAGGVITIEDNEVAIAPAMVAMSSTNSCALSNTGELKCWGLKTPAIAVKSIVGDAASDMGLNLKPVPISAHEPLEIATGATHSCARYSNSQVKCWGENSNGQLGQDSVQNYSSLNELLTMSYVNLGGTNVSKVCAGLSYSCALLQTGVVKCWGLLPGTTTRLGDAAGEMATLPSVSFAGGATMTDISCGSSHVCGVSTSGNVHCWGSGVNGRLGNNATTNITAAVPAVNLGTAVTALQVSAGEYSTCAVLQVSGGVKRAKCWGRNQYGQLGIGSTQSLGDGVDAASLPADEMGDNLPFLNFGGVSDVLRVVVGNDTACAELTGDQYRCWGLGNYSGIAATIGDSPGELAAAANLSFGAGLRIDDITVTDRGACAITEDTTTFARTVRCFGSNSDGKLGIGSIVGFLVNHATTSPVDLGEASAGIPFSPEVLSVGSVSDQTYCAIGNNASGVNEIRCWGSNALGQLGNGDVAVGDNAGEMGAALPVMSMGMFSGSPLEIVDVKFGGSHMCALSKSGKVKCIGTGTTGQLGLGTLSSYGGRTRSDTSLETLENQTVVNLPLPAIQIMATGNASCALLSDFTVRCWGSSILNGTSSVQSSPITMSIDQNRLVMGIFGSSGAICAHLVDQSVKCWGTNSSGIFGQNTDSASVIGDSAGEILSQPTINFGVDGSSVPLVVKNFSLSSSSGSNRGCARFTNNTSKCWGYNGFGVLGINNTTTVGGASLSVANAPLIQTAGSFLGFSLGNFHSCAILSNLTMKCWGQNTRGERGVGNTVSLGSAANSMSLVNPLDFGNNSGTPLKVTSWASSTVLGSSYGANCVVVEPGELKCWGEGSYGILGYGNENTLSDEASETPVPLPAVDLDF